MQVVRHHKDITKAQHAHLRNPVVDLPCRLCGRPHASGGGSSTTATAGIKT
ncbi:hypothetical protein Hanom_Chr14g01261681 [Helianthus anomalus]